MKQALIGTLVIWWLAGSLLAFQKTEQMLDYILKHNPVKTQVLVRAESYSQEDISELKIALLALVRLYQSIVSSQDEGSCRFTLSCSNFSISAIRRYGPLYGLLMTSDRLQRCHSLGKQYYPVDPHNDLAVDYPLDDYYLGRARK